MTIVGLIFLLVVCFPIGMGTNAAAAVATGLVFIGVPVLYFCPAINAAMRKHERRTAITILNVFLGWTLVGWVVALVWSYSTADEVKHAAPAAPAPAAEPPIAAPVVSEPVASGLRDCPFCAEPIKIAAVKCKHCGSDVSATAGQAL